MNVGGTRRETLAHDKYLDLLALFHHNGSVYDQTGEIAFQGIVKMTFDGGVYLGWFSNFTVQEAAEKPYMFDLSAEFQIHHEVMRLRSMPYGRGGFVTGELESLETIDPTTGQVLNPTPGRSSVTAGATNAVTLRRDT